MLLAAAAVIVPAAARAQLSSLWGVDGELWDPAGPLGDFSFAGYRTGNVPFPDRSGARIDVRSYGAIADDGADDTGAFQDAIDAARPGEAVYAPAGTYDFDGMLEIRKGDISVQGDGPDRTVLNFRRSLTEITGAASSTGTLYPLDDPDCMNVEPPPVVDGESWSFVGGLIWIEGQDPIDSTTKLADVVQPASRGERTLTLSSAAGITAGMWIRLTETDPPRTGSGTSSLVRHLHGDLVGGGCEQNGRMLVDFRSRVLSVAGSRVTLERYLPVDVRASWRPEIHRFEPTVQDVGIEDLALRFPATTYPGHFNEQGFNAIYLLHVVNSWVRNVDILNSDSGVFLRWSHFNTLDGVRIASTVGRGCHHAFNLPFLNSDNLITGFNVEQSCLHDLSVEQYSSGNVFAGGTGADVNMDHHRAAPYSNLFTDLDLGQGLRPFDSGGAAAALRGANTARYSTLWNVRAARAIALPPCDFGPHMIYVGVPGATPGTCSSMEWHIEDIAPTDFRPQDIHAAQLGRREACIGGDVTECIGGDGCCPSGCTYLSDGDCTSSECLVGSISWQNVPFEPQASSFAIRFDARPNDAAMDGLIMLSDVPGATWSDYAAAVRFYTTGFMDARDGDAYGPGTIPYEAGEVYRFRIDVDVPAHRYSVQVTLPDGTVEQLASDYAFRTEQAGVSQIGNWAVQANVGSHAVCLFGLETPSLPDGGVPVDGSVIASDGAVGSSTSGGCGCSTVAKPGNAPQGWAAGLLGACALALCRRRRRGPRRGGDEPSLVSTSSRQ